MARYCLTCGRQVVARRPCKCRATATSVGPPSFSRVYCRTCTAQARWRRVQIESAGHPPVISWECLGCGARRYQYADCTNVATMCITIMEENLRRTGANLDHDEAVSRLVLEAWRLYIAWDSEKGLTFESYAFGILRRRANDIYRQMLGRHGEKPLANAVSINSLRMEDTEWSELLRGDAVEPSFGDAAMSMAEGRRD